MTTSVQPLSTPPVSEPPTQKKTVASVWRYIRIGEYLMVGWSLTVIILQLKQGKGFAYFFQSQYAFPFFIPFFAVVCRHLIPLLWTSMQKLRWTAELTTTGAKASPEARQALNFSRELESGRKLVQLCRDAAPLYVFGLFYPMTDIVLRALREDKTYDDVLIKVDLLLFRCHLSVWMEQFITPWLSEYLSLCYFLHGILALVIVFFIALTCNRALLVETMQGFLLIGMIGFLLYILVPGVGPLYSLSALYTKTIAGGPMTEANSAVTDLLRAHRDVFPSLHVGISTLLLVYAWRANKIFASLLAPLIIGNWVSTIYLRYHYTIDVVVGWLLVPVVYYTIQWWMRRFPESIGEITPAPQPCG